MNTISMTDARRMIVAAYNKSEPLMLIGKPGMGKTALYESVATDLGISFIDFRLSMRDPVDVGGMRIPDTTTGKMKWFCPDDLPDPKVHGKAGIFLLDEINAIPPLQQAVAYGLIQERRVGSYRMVPEWVPMASGNRVADRAAAQRTSTALANRFNVQHVEPDLDSWLDQYGTLNADYRGCAFLRFRPKLFHVMPTADEVSFPSARSWTKAFKFIDEEPTFRRKIFAGYVGEAAADEFEAFWRVYASMISLDEIVRSPKTARLPDEKDPATYYAVAGMLGNMATRKNFDAIITYSQRLIHEYQVCIARDAVKRDPSLKQTGAYSKWAVATQDVTI